MITDEKILEKMLGNNTGSPFSTHTTLTEDILEDANYFSFLLDNPNKDSFSSNNNDDNKNSIINYFNNLSGDLDNNLKRLSSDKNLENMIEYNRSLSAFNIETQLVSKIAAKGAQAIEKLTNLQ